MMTPDLLLGRAHTILLYRFHENTLKQWDILKKRFSLRNQNYGATPNKLTLTDLLYFPFAMLWMFNFFGVDMKS